MRAQRQRRSDFSPSEDKRPSFTQVPDWVLDELAKRNYTGPEVILFIKYYGETEGYRPARDQAPLNVSATAARWCRTRQGIQKNLAHLTAEGVMSEVSPGRYRTHIDRLVSAPGRKPRGGWKKPMQSAAHAVAHRASSPVTPLSTPVVSAPALISRSELTPQSDLITVAPDLLTTGVVTSRKLECTGSSACPYFQSQLEAAKNVEINKAQENVRTFPSSFDEPTQKTNANTNTGSGRNPYLDSISTTELARRDRQRAKDLARKQASGRYEEPQLTTEERLHFEAIKNFSERHCGDRPFHLSNPMDRKHTRDVIAAIAGDHGFYAHAEREAKRKSEPFYKSLGILLRFAETFRPRPKREYPKDTPAQCPRCADLGAVSTDGLALEAIGIGEIERRIAGGTACACTCELGERWRL